MAERKYLVTGITGFVGPHLANLLVSEGHKVYGVVRTPGKEKDIKNVSFIYGDLTSNHFIEELFKGNKFDGVFHFAAQSSAPASLADAYGTFGVNTSSTVQITTAIERYQPKCSLVYASSAEVYGICDPSLGPINEDFLLNPVTPYGVSKAASELFLRERAHSVGLKFIIGRGFTSTGPGRPRNFAISSDAAQIAEIKAGKKKPVIDVGNLASLRGVMDIRDGVRAYYLLMQKGKPGEVYNIASEEVRKIGDYLNMMLELEGLKDKVKLKKDPSKYRKNDIPVQIPDTKKIRALGWQPKIPIEQTLKDLLEYWKNKI
jgi:GDP-4-dehydro-6-deoxy-D-mannose reductase